MADNGNIRTPVCRAVSPSATERNRGTTKNNPPWRRYWKKKIVSPPRNWRLSSMAGSTNGSAPGDLVTLPGQEPVHHYPAGQDQPQRGRDPEQRGCPAWPAPAPGTRAEHAENEQAQAGSGEHGADQVEVGAVLGGASATLRASTSMAATTKTSPTKTHRHERYVVTRPPISGPAATAIAPADITKPKARGRSEGASWKRPERRWQAGSVRRPCPPGTTTRRSRRRR